MNDMDNHDDGSLGSILASAVAKKEADDSTLQYQDAINDMVRLGLKHHKYPLVFLDGMAEVLGGERINKALYALVCDTQSQPVYKLDNSGCTQAVTAIKTIRRVMDLGLKEAKDLYEGKCHCQGKEFLDLVIPLAPLGVTIQRIR